jgi:hypothetical protein
MEKQQRCREDGCLGRILPQQDSADRSRLLRLLQDEFPGANEVSANEYGVVLLVRAHDFDQLGKLIGQLQRLIEARLPDRKDHLYVIIRDREDRRENVFKFWNDNR